MTTMTPPTGRATRQAAPDTNGRAYDWRDQAACSNLSKEEQNLFFPVPHTNGWKKQTQRAKAICAGCPVREACLGWALDTGQTGGVWGGLSERQRRAMRGDEMSQTQRCMDRQVWIETQLAVGMSQREIAQRLRVDKTTLSRAIAQFKNEREQAGGCRRHEHG